MDGIIVINKEKNYTSHDVVYKVKKLFGTKVGHTGTLDPNATGVLPILIGKGTQLSQFLINHDKKYIATIQLGVKTDTADIEGKIIQEKNVDLDNLNINKLYEYARSGRNVDIPERDIEIYDLKLLDLNKEEKTITYEIYCSKGTYVRTVCEKIAESLNTLGYMKELQRTMVGEFLLKDAITLDELNENFENQDFLNNKIISIEKFFENKPKIKLNDNKLRLFLNGVIIKENCEDGIIRIYDEKNVFIGIGICTNEKLKRKCICLK